MAQGRSNRLAYVGQGVCVCVCVLEGQVGLRAMPTGGAGGMLTLAAQSHDLARM